MECLVEGVRIVRGPHWEPRYGDYDGGEGHVGTVIVIEDEMDGGRPVVVQWDSGNRCCYRAGVSGKYDLRVFDTSPAGVAHPHVECSWCGVSPLMGVLWSCAQCIAYQLCSQCYHGDKHSVDHEFNRIDTPSSKRVRVPARYNCPRITARGIFQGAAVVRGANWEWGNEDGGEGAVGRVVRIEGWQGDQTRSMAVVRWRDGVRDSPYRVAHGGKVDLKYLQAADGGNYYPTHLPLLGSSHPGSVDLLSAGDSCAVETDPDMFRIAQEGHGGWQDEMAGMIGQTAVVYEISQRGTAIVRYSNNKDLCLNKEIITKRSVRLFKYGEIVRVLEDMVKVHQVMMAGPGWNDDMALCLGQLGIVLNVLQNDSVRIIVQGNKWVFHPDALELAPGEELPSYRAEHISVRIDCRIEVLSLLDANCTKDGIAAAVACGFVEKVREFLQAHPEEVNCKVESKTLLHTAIIEGWRPMLELIMEYKPDVDMESGSGQMPLHLCAFGNNVFAARLLLDAGANVNIMDSRGNSPITIAASQGHCEVLSVLLSIPQANPNFQDMEGKTPLHRAIEQHHCNSVKMLLDYGADPTLLNLRLFNAAHSACFHGLLRGMEELMRFHPELVNMKKDCSSSPLHIAAANNYYELVSLIASHPQCSVNLGNEHRLTALHIAVNEGHVMCVERLVGFGADINAIATDGTTPLHLAFAKKNMSTPTKDSPFIIEVQREVEARHGKGVLSPNVVVGIFLLLEGGDLHIKNQLGASPLKILPTDVAALVTTYKGRSSSFFGSLRDRFRPFKNELPKPIKGSQRIQTAPVASLTVREPLRPAAVSPIKTRSPNNPGNQPSYLHSQSEDSTLKRNDDPGKYKNPSDKPEDKPEAKQINKFNNKTATVSKKQPAASDIVNCYVCENGADIKLLPCSHVALCNTCAHCGQGAKKCPLITCRKPIDQFVPVCLYCKEEGRERYSPCGHSVCNYCKSRMAHCLACELLISN